MLTVASVYIASCALVLCDFLYFGSFRHYWSPVGVFGSFAVDAHQRIGPKDNTAADGYLSLQQACVIRITSMTWQP